jgi:phosphatidylglycerol:prolipoprotein diacylglycerol transferase
MHPILFQIGPFQIRFYGLMYAIGILCGLYLIRREVRRKHVQLSDDDLMNFVMLAVIGGILGARLYYVIFNWDFYGKNLAEIVKVWHGGLAIHGGMIGGILMGWWFTHRQQLSFWKMADITAPAIILGQALGRFGNFMNGDAHGLPTSMSWGIVFPPTSIAGRQFPGTPLHPTMLYELLFNVGIFLLLWTIRTRPWKDGFLFCMYLILYSVGRFIVSFFRADDLMFGPFRMPHLISILIIAAASLFIVIRRLWEQTSDAS